MFRLRLVLAVLSAAGPAVAATVNVNPGMDNAALNLAIQAAAAGDVVLFQPGSYAGPILVASDKVNLTLKSKGKVTLDGRPGGAAVGPVVVVEADGVLLQGFSIQHPAAGSSGNGIEAGDAIDPVNGLTVKSCIIAHCEAAAVAVFGSDLTVVDCAIVDCADAITVQGDDAAIKKCSVLGAYGGGITVTGDGGEVSGCNLRVIGPNDAIAVFGGAAVVTKNVVAMVSGVGIRVDGSAFEITKNKVAGAVSGGLFVSGGPLGTVAKNTVMDCENSALTGAGVGSLLVDSNKALRCGDPNGSGVLFLVGDGMTIRKNTCADSFASAFVIKGDGNHLLQNRASDGSRDGFLIQVGSDNVIEKCTALGNRGEGFQNDDLDGGVGPATGSSLIGCVAKGNRLDVAVATPFTTFTGNTFATGGNDATEDLPEIED